MNKFRLKIFLTVFAFLLINAGSEVRGQFSFELTLKNNYYSHVSFYSVSAYGVNILLSSKIIDNKVVFSNKSDIPQGMYRLYLSDTVFLDIVGGSDKKIVLESVAGSLADSLRIIQGDENKRFYSYVQFRNRELKNLAAITALIKPANSKKLNPLADERISFLQGAVAWKIQKYADSIYYLDTSAFVSRLIKAQVVPNVNIEMLEDPDGKYYNNDIEFLLVHFFDNIDFSDSLFLQTEIYTRTVKYYVEKIALPRNVTGFNYANDFILKKAAASKPVYRYVLSLLFDLYEDSQLEDVYVNLYDNYFLKDTLAVSKIELKKIEHKIDIIKNLTLGSMAPDISGKDTLGNEIKLSSVKAKVTMLFIWKPGDEHSVDAMTQLGDIYKKYKEKGLEVYAFALDSNETHFFKSISNIDYGWKNVSDLLGDKSPVCSEYNTWSLPGIYIMDEKMKITAKPMNMDYVKKEFEKLDK